MDSSVYREPVEVEDVDGLCMVTLRDRGAYLTLGPGVDPTPYVTDPLRNQNLCNAAVALCDWMEQPRRALPN